MNLKCWISAGLAAWMSLFTTAQAHEVECDYTTELAPDQHTDSYYYPHYEDGTLCHEAYWVPPPYYCEGYWYPPVYYRPNYWYRPYNYVYYWNPYWGDMFYHDFVPLNYYYWDPYWYRGGPFYLRYKPRPIRAPFY